MAVELLFGRKSPGKIGSLELDATLTERHNYHNEVTSFPIESGSSISDHVIQMPEEVEIEGFVTNTPIEFLSGLRSGKEDRVLNAYLILLDIAGYRWPGQAYRFNKLEVISENEQFMPEFVLIEILTSLRLYTNMALISLNIPRDAKTGDTVRFSASFRRINIVDTREVARSQSTITETPGAPRASKQDVKPTDAGKAGVGKLESIPDKVLDWATGVVD